MREQDMNNRILSAVGADNGMVMKRDVSYKS